MLSAFTKIKPPRKPPDRPRRAPPARNKTAKSCPPEPQHAGRFCLTLELHIPDAEPIR